MKISLWTKIFRYLRMEELRVMSYELQATSYELQVSGGLQIRDSWFVIRNS